MFGKRVNDVQTNILFHSLIQTFVCYAAHHHVTAVSHTAVDLLDKQTKACELKPAIHGIGDKLATVAGKVLTHCKFADVYKRQVQDVAEQLAVEKLASKA